ncbi:hypothetical protein FS749_012831 [Ceratobasidium sp. UAMH 11750]|nr:hypothetical protein FS749_012831 [Ceratobasidium sp. UAMH 11750]
MPTPPQQQTQAQNEGFSSGGDLTLRSLDGVDFSVHSIVLSIASPVLADMFCIGTQKTTVDVAESSEMLSLMLNFIYPRPPPQISSFDTLETAIHIADKYQLEGMKHRLREKLLLKGSPVSVFSDPLHALAFASVHGLAEEAKLAASLACESHDFHKVDDLMKLINAMPPIVAPVVKMIGVPSARIVILIDVLFQFHRQPMALMGDNCNHFMCSVCDKVYLDCARYGAPEWQARWAHWVFQELKTRPISRCDDLFTAEFLVLAMNRGDVELPSKTCGCHNRIRDSRFKPYFEIWAAGVRACLIDRLTCLDQFNEINASD